MTKDREQHRREYREYYLANREKVLAKNAKWWAAHPEKSRAKSKKYRKDYPEKVIARNKADREKPGAKKRARELALKWNYGITTKDYERMLRAQKGQCAVCSRSSKKKLCVDHDHESGKVRGLLCKKCDFALGLLDDSLSSAEGLVGYLKKYASS